MHIRNFLCSFLAQPRENRLRSEFLLFLDNMSRKDMISLQVYARAHNLHLARALFSCVWEWRPYAQTAHQVRTVLYDGIVAIAETNTADGYFENIGRPAYCIFRWYVFSTVMLTELSTWYTHIAPFSCHILRYECHWIVW